MLLDAKVSACHHMPEMEVSMDEGKVRISFKYPREKVIVQVPGLRAYVLNDQIVELPPADTDYEVRLREVELNGTLQWKFIERQPKPSGANRSQSWIYRHPLESVIAELGWDGMLMSELEKREILSLRDIAQRADRSTKTVRRRFQRVALTGLARIEVGEEDTYLIRN